MRDTGEPVNDVRRAVENVTGRDLGDTVIHTDTRATRSAQRVSANAYTVGNHIVFGSGRYQPETDAGRELLAHELGHVAQQQASATPTLQRQGDDDHATDYREVRLRFDGLYLRVYGDGEELFRYAASSGRPILVSPEHAEQCGGSVVNDTYMNARYVGIEDNGPIPEGTYRFGPRQIQRLSTGEQVDALFNIHPAPGELHGDWGEGRVPLQPVHRENGPCGNTQTRHSFFLHGGILAGSSGCIDIGGDFDNLADFLEGYPRRITLEVEYEHPEPYVGALTGFGGAVAYWAFHFRHGPRVLLGAELGEEGEGSGFVLSAEYQAFLDWAGGAVAAGVHVDVPMNSEEAFIRAGLRGMMEMRILYGLYAQVFGGGFIESVPETPSPEPEPGEAAPSIGLGGQFGAGLMYDFGAPELSLLYNFLDSNVRRHRHQLLLGLGFHW